MQFIDLRTQYEALKDEIDIAVQEVLLSAQFIGGKGVKQLEEQLAAYIGRKFCITCANGTDALTLAMMAYGITQGDAVFVPTFTFYASAETVSLVGATPIFVDIDRQTFNILPDDLEKAIEEVYSAKELKPRAIVAVDLFGLPCNFERIAAIADKYNLLVIEDGAQGFGGTIKGKKSCSFGDISTTSFFPAKPLGCYGDGGAIFTDEENVKNHIESLKVHGKGKDKYDNVRVGMNSRLDTLQAAILHVKLKAFNEYELEARQRISELYSEKLQGIVETPYIPKKYTSSYAQYSILFKNEEERNQMQRHLAEHGIPTMIYYPKGMHQQTVYSNNLSVHRGFLNAEYVSQRVLNLPMHSYLLDADLNRICDIICGESREKA